MTSRWRYVVPNLVTCLSISAAMLSIAEAVTGRFESSAWFALLCVLLDKADGTVARLLSASSRFGIEMDSLSDLIGFGVAPAAMVLCLLAGQGAITPLAGLPAYRAAVYVGCILYVVAAALRLAKFNVLTGVYGSEYFFGIPTTVCGGLLMAYFLTARKYGAPVWAFELMPGAMVLLAILMVSRIPLPKMGKRRSRLVNIFTISNVSLLYVVGLLRIFPEYMFAAGAVYMVLGSGLAIARGVRPPGLAPAAGEASESEIEAAGDDGRSPAEVSGP